MKYFLIFLSMINTICCCYGQKQVLTDTTYKVWTEVVDGGINSNGSCVFYTIKNKPLNSRTLVVKSLDKKWQKELIGHQTAAFSDNNRLMFSMIKDTLFQMDILNGKSRVIASGCADYQLVGEKINEWIIYKLNDATNTTILKNLSNGKTESFKDVRDIITNKAGRALILKIKEDKSKNEHLLWFSAKSGTIKEIYSGQMSRDYIFDNSGDRMSFGTVDTVSNSIWYFDKKMTAAQEIASDQSDGIEKNFRIEKRYTWRFSDDGNFIFFTLTKKRNNTVRQDDPVIWNYKDAFLQSRYQRFSKSQHNDENLSVVDLATWKVRQLLHNTEKVMFSFGCINDVLVVESHFGEEGEADFIPSAQKKYYLCFIKTGEMRPLEVNCDMTTMFSLSPDNTYLLYYTDCNKQYLVYNTVSKQTSSIGNNITDLGIPDVAHRDWRKASPVVGWLKENNHAILQGQFDLWDIDLSGKVRPFNLTKGKGLKSNTVFAFADPDQSKVISEIRQVLISGFNIETKENSLDKLDIKKRTFVNVYRTNQFLALPYEHIDPARIKKASETNKYLLRTETASQSPNFIYTKDFKSFIHISNNYPESKFNWYTSRLARYKDKEENNCEAIIFTPDNFDERKKYPVILHYYREVSNELNDYITPNPVSAGFNLPLLVSNGYIVVTPNIYVERGRPVDVPVNSILAAVDYLKRFDWVDSMKMGIMGHSLGGHETNYFITHTNRFAAAVSASSSSNIIQAYNTIWEGILGQSQQGYTYGTMAFGNRLEENPKLYIEASAILNTTKIITPLLLMHNMGDLQVPVSQSTQFFIQLRSMKKPVWLLQYEGETHTIRNVKNQIDFQSKVKEFFDYYLKDKPMPDWMNNPIK